jgi:hypothetical protein
MASSNSKIDDVQSRFKNLSTTAASLNAASSELARVVGVLDEALRSLNIGLTVWVTYDSDDATPSQYDDYQIGYIKKDGRWGIGLRHVWGEIDSEESSMSGPWLFNDGPREMRLRSVDAIPKLIEKLNEEAVETAKRVENKTNEVRMLAGAISHAANESQRTRTENKQMVHTSGLSSIDQAAILNNVRQEKKFLGELLDQVMLWELLGSGELHLYFSVEKKAFAELLEGREAIAKINAAAEAVLGHPVRTVAKIFKPPTGTGAVKVSK